jgi:hypothetical protein
MVTTHDELTAEYMSSRWPRLYHMAEAGSWTSIQAHGLLSTSALLDLFEITGAQRELIESVRRPDSVPIEHPVHGTAWIRDNKPINETVLRRTLVGMTEREWYRTLNRRVFFWLNTDRLDRLRNAPPYRDRKHDILTLDTAALLGQFGDVVELAHLNTGAVHPSASYPRGKGTFMPISTYPWRQRLGASSREPIVELTVPYAVPNAEAFILDVTTR